MKKKHYLLLVVFVLITFFANRAALPTDIMEARNIVTAREMVEEVHWLVPTMNGELRHFPPRPCTYSKLYGINTVGLRFFTVYGPWGRPDMAPLKFMDDIVRGRELQVFNHGNMLRDFTYIDDIVKGICLVLNSEDTQEVPARIYNIGNSHPVRLLDFIRTIEGMVGRKARMHMMDMQPGDVVRTYADTSRLQNDFGYKPSTTLRQGITCLYEWYMDYTVMKSHTETAIMTFA